MAEAHGAIESLINEVHKNAAAVSCPEIKVAAGYRTLNQGRAQRNWYARFDPVTAENLSYENIK